jgi:hypothetical protein
MRGIVMKKCFALIVAYILFLASFAWAAEEVRPLGMSSATGGYSGDIRVGNTCTTSPLGKYYCGLNARHIYFFSDNTVDVDNLYPLASADTGFPYVSGGTWTIDSLSTYRGRLGTGTKDNTTYLRGDGTWAVPPDTAGAATTTLPWDNITATPTTLVGYGITDYGVPTALPWDNITRTLSAGVTDTELSYVDNVTSAIQTQINAKQAYDADLVTLSGPTAWRIFYSNGTSQITELPLGTDNQCLQSTGVYAAPEWGSCGTGSGDYDAAAVTITGGTIDNTVIGGTTPAAGSFSSLTRGVVSDTEFSYLNGVTSAIQTQLGLKRALDNVTFAGAGVASFDNTVQALQFESTGADNTHYINVANSGPPNVGTEVLGDCYYDNTTTAWLCWDGDSWESPAFTAIGSGTNPTVDSSGEIAVDTTATPDQLRYFGDAEVVLDARRTENATFKSPVSGDKAKFRKPFGMTVTSVGCATDAATSAVLDAQECDANGATCSTILSGAITCGTTYQYTDGTPSVSDSSIAAGGYVFFSVGTVTGTVGYLYVDFNYTVTKE